MNRAAKALVLFTAAALLGWAGTSVALRRKVSAAWRGAPALGGVPAPPRLANAAAGRVQRLAQSFDVADFATWLGEIAAETSSARLLQAIDDAKALPAEWRTFAVRVALERLADLDPAATLDFCLVRLGDGTVAWNALANAVRLRFAGDPASLRRCLEAAAVQLAHGDGGAAELGRSAPEECCEFIARHGLPLDHPVVMEAVRRAGRTSPGSVFRHGLHAVIEHERREPLLRDWIALAPDEALEWMRTFGEGEAKSRALAEALVAWKKGDAEARATVLRTAPLDAVRLLAEADPAGVWPHISSPFNWEEVNSGISEWISAHQHEPGWEEKLPPEWRQTVEKGRRQAEARSRFGSDAAAARAWLDALPAGERAQALGGAVAALADDDPAQAASILSSGPRGALWAEAELALGRKWAGYDPAAAKRWLDTLPPLTAREAAVAAGIERP